MTKVILEITNQADLRILLPLLDRLGIEHLISEEEPTLTEADRQYHTHVLEEGVNDIDWEQRIKDFKKGRADRPLPYRED